MLKIKKIGNGISLQTEEVLLDIFWVDFTEIFAVDEQPFAIAFGFSRKAEGELKVAINKNEMVFAILSEMVLVLEKQCEINKFLKNNKIKKENGFILLQNDLYHDEQNTNRSYLKIKKTEEEITLEYFTKEKLRNGAFMVCKNESEAYDPINSILFKLEDLANYERITQYFESIAENKLVKKKPNIFN